MKKIVWGIVLLLLSICISIVVYQIYKPRVLTFRVEAFSSENIQILVENEPVIKKGYRLYPITLTTTRSVSVTIGKETQYVKIKRLSKITSVAIDIVFKDGTKRYFLQTLPTTFPEFSVKNSSYKKGYVLISLHGLKLHDPSYSFILDMDGQVMYYRGHPKVKRSMFHLKKITLPNGKIRYITHVQDGWGLDKSYVIGYHLIMDENFRELERVKILRTSKHRALLADEHDILMLDDGHYIVTGQKIEDIVLDDGEKTLITHTIIQEQKNKKVVFDWDSSDYPELQKACYEKCPGLSEYNADYIHVNSLFIDPKDNNLLVSSASGYYVMKLDRKTGEVLWILGGKANQFQMPQEAEFIRQHHVQILPDSTLIMFDNHISSMLIKEALYHNKFFVSKSAQILILGIDEINKEVTSVRTIPLNFLADYMGSVQQLEDGWFIGCGSSDECTARLIDLSGSVLWDMKAEEPYKMFRSYYYFNVS